VLADGLESTIAKSSAEAPSLSGDGSSSKASPAASEIVYVLRFIAFPLLIIIVSHHLIVNSFSLDTIYLRIASLVVPFPFGVLLHWHTRLRSGLALAVGAVLGVVATAAMTTSEGFNSGQPIMPATTAEWKENLEYAASIALSFFTGSLLGMVIFAVRSKKSMKS